MTFIGSCTSNEKLTKVFPLFRRTHYGTEFRIELVDASTERVMGTCLITTQGLLQSQRDYLVEEMRVPLLSFLRPFRFVEMRRVILELRAGFKSGFSSTDYFASSKRGCLSDAEIQPGMCCYNFRIHTLHSF